MADVGMYQDRARWLDTRTGRFTAMDPERGKARLPISLHGFIYSGDSPVSYVDPAGHDLVEISATLLAVGAVSTAVIASANSYKYWRRGSHFVGSAELLNLPELQAAYGASSPRTFDEGVEALIYYWWSFKDVERDAEAAFGIAKSFRNRSLAIEQDPRIATAEHYLWGLTMYFEHSWLPMKAIGAGGEAVRRIEPFWMPPTGSFPPSIYAETGYEWFRRGLDGEGTIMVPIECWQHEGKPVPPYCR